MGPSVVKSVYFNSGVLGRAPEVPLPFVIAPVVNLRLRVESGSLRERREKKKRRKKTLTSFPSPEELTYTPLQPEGFLQ